MTETKVDAGNMEISEKMKNAEDNGRKRVAVLFGGCSTEYEVSLQSAYAVITSLDTGRYEPVLIGIERTSGQWYLYRGEPAAIPDDRWYSPGNMHSGLRVHGPQASRYLCKGERGHPEDIS